MPQITIDEAKTEMPKRMAKIQTRTKFELAPGDHYTRAPSSDEAGSASVSGTTKRSYGPYLKGI